MCMVHGVVLSVRHSWRRQHCRHHPIDRGFDFYVGVPYSVDMGCGATPTITFAPTPAYNSSLCPACPLSGQPMPDLPPETSCHRKCGCIMDLGVPIFYNKTIKEQPVDLGTVSDQYGAAAEDFIETADGMYEREKKTSYLLHFCVLFLFLRVFFIKKLFYFLFINFLGWGGMLHAYSCS